MELGRDAWRSKHARYLATTSFGSLDGLRALSILAVVWHHTGPGFAALPITKRGFLGVDLFFVISGFLIVTLLLRERRRTGGISLRRFYARRFLRIVPAYWALLLLAGGMALLGHRGTPNPVLGDLPFAALYLSNLVPMHSLLSITWSLSAEEQFYFIVPALEKYAHRAFGLLLPILYVAVSLPPFGVFAGVPLPGFFRQTTFGPILLGVLLAHLLDSPGGYRQVARVLGGRGAGLWALALVLVTCSTPAADISGWPRLAIHWSLAILVASCVVQERHALSPLLQLAPLRRLGVVSYGIYLYHLVVLHFVENLAAKRGLSAHLPEFVATALASWLVAELSFRLFEARFLAQKRRFAAPLAAEPVAAASAPGVMGQPSL
jgi:peptidoglycan/LPS O-acetylase OafA/YrhL